MKYILKLGDEKFRVNVEDENGRAVVESGDFSSTVDFARLDPALVSIVCDKHGSFTAGVVKKGKKVQVFSEGTLYEFESVTERELSASGEDGGLQISSPMPSRVVKILKNEGDSVAQDEGVVVVEAMKMESELKASVAGKIKEIKVKEGDAVEGGAVLVVLEGE
ncbi:MAG: biotin/lipoyl-binding protein [Candidatus Mycalebacterium zealandia]|nr:MAG: biotin/lipoyl-binding protein [Candidatus Mycalebacterium zealandia]